VNVNTRASIGDSDMLAVRGPWARVIGPAVVLLLPLLLLSVTPTILIQSGKIDPFVYSAYIHDYRQIYAIFGATYYANRIAAIDPGRVAMWLFGAEAGYYVVRYVLLAMACASIYSIARRFYGTGVAVAAAALLCFSPWYVRSIAYDYVDGFAITYLLLAIAFLITPRRHVAVGHALAGAFFAFAVNTNLYTLAIAGSFAPSWFILRARQGARQSCLNILAMTCGFVAAYIGLGVVLHVEFPDRPLFFEGVSIAVAQDLFRGGAVGSASYFRPLADFLAHNNYYVFVPVVLLAAMLVLLARMGRGRPAHARDFAIASGVYLGVITVVYLVNHFAFHHARITLTYYFSYVAIAGYLAVLALLGETMAAVEPRKATIALAVAGGIYFLEYSLYTQLVAKTTMWPVWLWAPTAAALPIGLIALRDPLRRLCVVLVCVVAIPVSFYHSDEDYVALHSRTQGIEEWDVYRGSEFLQATIRRVINPRGDYVRFWYNGALPRHANLNSVQSTYLWGYSRITRMPELDASALDKISKARYLVLLGLTDGENDKALASLSNARIRYRMIEKDEFVGTLWSFRFITIELLRDRQG
jgi:hypothetical protein